MSSNSSPSTHSNATTIIASLDEVGNRLDKVLAQSKEIGSRAKAQHLIDSHLVHVNGKRAKASQLLKAGDRIEFSLPLPTPSSIQPLPLQLNIVFEDADLIVLNKPAGLVVHPGAGHANDTLVNALAAHTENLSMRFGEDRPGIVHRIDKETSGLLVIAKNDRAHENLTQQFQKRQIHRIYYAVTIGYPTQRSGRLASFLARHPVDRKRYASIRGNDKKVIRDQNNPPIHGKIAITNYDFLSTAQGLGYVRVKLETGRTHQIRVHLSELGYPIAGDVLYGANRRLHGLNSITTQGQLQSLNRFLLHAAELGFNHPLSGNKMLFQCKWPPEIESLLQEWHLLV